MIARELMTANPKYISPTTSIREAIQTMMDGDFRHLPVVQGGELVGVISDRDLQGYSWDALMGDPAASKSSLGAAVSNVMSGDVLSVGPEAEASEIIDLMVDEKIGALPVVDDASGDLVGIISTLDVLKYARDAI